MHTCEVQLCADNGTTEELVAACAEIGTAIGANALITSITIAGNLLTFIISSFFLLAPDGSA
jgi:hypothetical protein